MERLSYMSSYMLRMSVYVCTINVEELFESFPKMSNKRTPDEIGDERNPEETTDQYR